MKNSVNSVNSVNQCQLSDSAKQSLCLIGKSKQYILLLILAIAIAYYTVNVQEKQVIAAECCPENLDNFPDMFPFRLSGNVLAINALCFFCMLARQYFCKNTDPTNCSPSYNYTASILALGAGLILLYDLFYVKGRGLQPHRYQHSTKPLSRWLQQLKPSM